MMDNKNTRDVLDVAAHKPGYPEENLPKKAERPSVSPQESGYFLNKFLEQQPADSDNDSKADSKPSAQAGIPPATKEELEANIIAALQEIYDPEIPVNIYELGLIYAIDIADDYSVKVSMTLTTPNCPVAESMPGEVELKVSSVNGVNGVEVALVWEPAWDMGKMSDEARLELGLL